MKNFKKEDRYHRAVKHVEDIRKFYYHLAVYLIVNIGISGIKIYNDMNDGDVYVFGAGAVWLFWGIGLAFHAFKVFVIPFIMGKNWEEDKIKKYMNEDSHNRWE